MKYQVLIFTQKDDRDEGWARAHSLFTELNSRPRKPYAVRLVNKSGFVLDDLRLVARYRVVTTPSTLILRDEKVVYRRLGLPSARTATEVIAALSRPAKVETSEEYREEESCQSSVPEASKNSVNAILTSNVS